MQSENYVDAQDSVPGVRRPETNLISRRYKLQELFFIILLMLFTIDVHPVSCENLKVAVANYKPLRDHQDFAHNIIERNVNEYTKLIENASKKDVKMIVFPEYGLTTDQCVHERYPSVFGIGLEKQLNKMPCLDQFDTDVNLIKLSCAAITHRMHVGVNLIEDRGNDTICQSTIVFDDLGVLTKIYRKKYVTDEYGVFQRGDEEDSTVINTKFGNFTISSGLDILFKKPEPTERRSSDSIILTSSVECQYPFMHGPSLYQGFSKSNNVTLLVSSLKDRKYEGSGIYDKNNRISSDDELIIANVPLNENSMKLNRRRRSKRKINTSHITYSFKSYESCLHNLDEPTENCNISVSFKNNIDRIDYKKATCLNTNILGNTGNSAVCALVYCPDNICETKFMGSIKIEHIHINMTYTSGSVIQSLPTTLKSDNEPIENYDFRKVGNNFYLNSMNEENQVISFGILLIVNEEDSTETSTISPMSLDNFTPNFLPKSGTHHISINNFCLIIISFNIMMYLASSNYLLFK